MAIAVITDTAACLTPLNLAEFRNIITVPFYINYSDGSSERDIPGMDRAKLYASLKGKRHSYFGRLRYKPALPDQLPQTSQPNKADYLIAAEIAIEKGFTETIGVSLSSKVSGSYSSLVSASQESSIGIYPYDSYSVSMGQGFMVLAAAKALEEGASVLDVIGIMDRIRDRYVLLQTMTTLKYLERGGRIGKAKSFVGGLLGKLPIVSFEDGEVVGAGTGDKLLLNAFREMVQIAKSKVGIKPVQAAFVHGEEIEGAIGLKELILQAQKELNINGKIMKVPQVSVLLPYTGPDTFGMILLPD